MKKFLISLLCFYLASSNAAIVIDGVAYDLDAVNKSAKIVYNGDNFYSGNIVIPNEVVYKDVKYIVSSTGNYAFQLKDLTSVTLPNTIEELGEGLFALCRNLKSVKLPEGINKIPPCLFSGCDNLESIEIPNTVTSIGYLAFNGCKSIKEIEIPNAVTFIGYEAFGYCSKLKSFKFPNGVRMISESVLENCTKLEIIEFGNDIEKIGAKILNGCSSIKDIYIYTNIIPETDANSFYNCNAVDITLHVPDNVVSTYSGASPWNQFGKIVGCTDGITKTLAGVESDAILLFCHNGMLSVKGMKKGDVINIYNALGQIMESVTADSDEVDIITSVRKGEIGIVSIGNKSFKILFK